MGSLKSIKIKGRHGVVVTEIDGHGLPCPYCERRMIAGSLTHPTKDHVVPKSKGGKLTVLACFQCNQIKSDMMPDQWEEFCRKNPMWWAKRQSEYVMPISYVAICPVLTTIAQFFYEKRYGVWTPRL